MTINNTLDKYLYDIDYVLTNFNKIKIHENAEKYYINGGIIDERRFIEKDFNENDEFVRVYSSKEFIGIGKIIRKNNTISVKSDKLFIRISNLFDLLSISIIGLVRI